MKILQGRTWQDTFLRTVYAGLAVATVTTAMTLYARRPLTPVIYWRTVLSIGVPIFLTTLGCAITRAVKSWPRNS